MVMVFELSSGRVRLLSDGRELKVTYLGNWRQFTAFMRLPVGMGMAVMAIVRGRDTCCCGMVSG